MTDPALHSTSFEDGARSAAEWLTRVAELDKAIAVLEAQRSTAILEFARAHAAEHTLSGVVERITGHPAGEIPIEVQVVVPIEALVEPSSPLPAELPGHGPVPADVIKDATSWRRLVTTDGVVIGGDSRRRTFTGVLAELIRARDGHRCRARYCDAPIRHIDHIQRWSDGGRTSFDNGRGLCAFHNLVRETDEIDDAEEVRNGTTGEWRAHCSAAPHRRSGADTRADIGGPHPDHTERDERAPRA